MEIHFDIDKIVKIKFVGKQEEERIRWVEPKPIKKFFGLYNTRRSTEGHFADFGSYLDTKYTERLLREYGYIVEGKKVYRFPHVEVHFEHDDSVNKSFQTDSEALQWVEELKATSGKTFEIIKY